MKLTHVLNETNAELHRRRDAGLSTEIVDLSGEILADADGLFLRITIHMSDGDSFMVDTTECESLLNCAAAILH